MEPDWAGTQEEQEQLPPQGSRARLKKRRRYPAKTGSIKSFFMVLKLLESAITLIPAVYLRPSVN